MADRADFDSIVEPYHDALKAIINGNPDGYKEMYPERDDVTLANPFERYRAKVGDSDEFSPSGLRVTSVFRPEAGSLASTSGDCWRANPSMEARPHGGRSSSSPRTGSPPPTPLCRSTGRPKPTAAWRQGGCPAESSSPAGRPANHDGGGHERKGGVSGMGEISS
jgi:hypothetical protein